MPATATAEAPIATWPRAPLAVVVAGCLTVAGVSLAFRASIAFDPWTWLVWGREVAGWRLDTTGGPSWKPLPVLVTTVLAPLGDLAPTAWVMIARAMGLLAVAMAYRLAKRFAGPAAGVMAAALLVLAPDGGPRFLRTVLEGHSAPAEAAFALLAIEAHLDDRHGRALVVATALALLRPEAWPFLLAYAGWLWWREPTRRVLVAVVVTLVPLLWFGGDWWGSGSPLHGADTAQVISDGPLDRLGSALDRVAKVVVAPAWVAAMFAVGRAVHRRERELPTLAILAAAWSLLVVAMSVLLGYAALSRFLLPAGAVLCVLAGVGLVWLYDAVPRGAPRAVFVVVALLVSAPLVLPRVTGLQSQLAGVAERHRVERSLDLAIARAGGREALTRCGAVVADRVDLPQSVLAWELDLALHDVRSTRRGRSGSRVVILRAGGREERRLQASEPAELVPLGDSAHWSIVAVDCS